MNSYKGFLEYASYFIGKETEHNNKQAVQQSINFYCAYTSTLLTCLLMFFTN